MLSSLLYTQDIRYAFRLLRRSPGFALLTVLVLAGGLGLSTFTFSFLYTAMMRPLPLNDGKEVVRLTQLNQGRRTPTSPSDITSIRASVKTVEDLGGYTKHEVLMGRDQDTRVLKATLTEPVMFKVARTPPMLGRALIATDGDDGAEPTIVLSHQLWASAFNSDSAAVNSLITINSTSTRVVGVMPEGFGFPVTQDVWLPIAKSNFRYALASGAVDNHEPLQLFGRLKSGSTASQASAEVSTLLQRAIATHDTSSSVTRYAMAVESFPAAQIGDERTIVFTALNLAAAMILLLALMNVMTLLLARANERIRETAVRLALGASRGRLVLQGMWETIILCIVGGVVGTVSTAWGLETVTAWTRINMPDSMAFWWVWQIDAITIAGAGMFVTVAIAALGAVTSIRATRTNVRAVLQDGSARAGSRRDGRLSRILVATQIATVTVLMFAGVLSAVMGQRILNRDPGYDISHMLQVEFGPPANKYETDRLRAELFRNVRADLQQNAAIDAVLLRTKLANKNGRGGAFTLRGTTAALDLPSANIFATMGNISTLNISTLEGRSFESSDDVARTPVVAVSKSLALRLWPGRSALGQQIRLANVSDTTQWRTIVAVVSDIPYGSQLSRDRSADAIYLPLLQSGVEYTDVMVRYRASETDARQAINRTFSSIDPTLVPGYIYRSAEVARQAGLVTTGLAKLLGGCFAFALLLAVAGTYGLMSRSIGLRTREIGVRRALGASDSATAQMLLKQAARQLGVGTVAAIPLLAVSGTLAWHYLPLSGALAISTGVLVSLSVMSVVLLATWFPTRRVLRVNLREALGRE